MYAVRDGAGDQRGLAWQVFTPNVGLNEKMRLDSSGNLGLGVTPSAWSSAFGPVIQVKTGSGGGALTGSDTDNFRMFANTFYDGAYKRIGAGFATQYEQAVGRHIWSTAGTSTANSSITFTEVMRLDASGNLGLGVTPSAWGSLWKSLQVARGAFGNYNNTSTIVSDNAYEASGWKYIGSAAATAYYQTAGQHQFFTAPSGTAGNAISFTQAMTLDASGNLGVGTTSPYNQLESTKSGGSTIGIANSSSGASILYGKLAFYSTVAAGAYAEYGGQIRSYSGAGIDYGDLRFYTGNGAVAAERARITSGGYFKASDAGTYVNATGTFHELRNTANETAALFSCSNTGFTSSVMSSTAYPVAGTGFKHLICRSDNGNDEVMNIRGDGNLYNDNGVYGSISDQRLKQDIADAPSQWNDIKAVRFRKYRMKDDVARDENAPYLLGVVAQELEQTSPGLVDDGEVKTVKSSILLMKAAVALQEAMARIEQLEAKVAALESK
jgi:hypothetical protein